MQFCGISVVIINFQSNGTRKRERERLKTQIRINPEAFLWKTNNKNNNITQLELLLQINNKVLTAKFLKAPQTNKTTQTIQFELVIH